MNHMSCNLGNDKGASYPEVELTSLRKQGVVHLYSPPTLLLGVGAFLTSPCLQSLNH